MRKRTDILVVGQTPPPIHGQAVMIREFLNGEYASFTLHHVPWDFSVTIADVGKFQVRKLLHMISTLRSILVARFRNRAEAMYFPPTGPHLFSILRDVFLLLGSRWLFRYTIFHFHAAGLMEIYPRLPWFFKPLFNLAYGKPDLAIVLTNEDGRTLSHLQPGRISVIPYGIRDQSEAVPAILERGESPRIFFMGVLCEGKGVLTLLDACAVLKKLGVSFRATFAGAFQTPAFREEVEQRISTLDLADVIDFAGVVSGDTKAAQFAAADIFCFPTHYHAESFGVVLIEAMSFGLPIVTTRWRGIPEVVGETGEGAVLVEPRQPELLAQALIPLLEQESLRRSMGAHNRELYLNRYTLDRFRRRMEQEIGQTVGSSSALAASAEAVSKGSA